MAFSDIISLMLLLFAFLLLGLAIWNLKYKDGACEKCPGGYCAICSKDSYNRGIFYPLIQWIKKYYNYDRKRSIKNID